MSKSPCVLSINWGLPLSELQSKEPDYFGQVRRLVPWNEIERGLELPKDKTLSEVLKELRRQDDTLPDLEAGLKLSITNLRYQRRIDGRPIICHWKYASLQSGADRALAQAYPGIDLKDLVDSFANSTQHKPTTYFFRPDDFEKALTSIHESLLIETRTGKVGAAQRFRTHCSTQDCPAPRFKPGQRPILAADGTWKHATDDGNTLSPLYPFTNKCSSCPRAFIPGKSIFTTIERGLPEHLYSGTDVKAYTCSEAIDGEEGYWRR